MIILSIQFLHFRLIRFLVLLPTQTIPAPGPGYQILNKNWSWYLIFCAYIYWLYSSDQCDRWGQSYNTIITPTLDAKLCSNRWHFLFCVLHGVMPPNTRCSLTLETKQFLSQECKFKCTFTLIDDPR